MYTDCAEEKRRRPEAEAKGDLERQKVQHYFFKAEEAHKIRKNEQNFLTERSTRALNVLRGESGQEFGFENERNRSPCPLKKVETVFSGQKLVKASRASDRTGCADAEC